MTLKMDGREYNHRLGQYGFVNPVTNKVHKTPLWCYEGEKNMKTENKKEKMPELKIVESKNIDITPYVGMKSTIDNIEMKKGVKGFYLLIESLVLANVEGVSIKASRLFSLKTDEKGNISIPSKGDLVEFMTQKKVSDYRDLLGKDIIVLSKSDNNGRDWLTIY